MVSFISLPFTFSIFSDIYAAGERLSISTNGWISLEGASDRAYQNASLPAATVPQTSPPPKVVLQLGDSFVGGWNGLAKALAPRFEALGSKFVRDWQDSVSIATYDHERRLDDLIAKNKPDLVLVTLGANDVSVPFPSALAKHVSSIARKVSADGRACIWLTPPLWKKDTGIVDVIKQNAAPCKVFDGSHLKLSRGGDGIHPNDSGGRTWADAFFVFYNQEATQHEGENVATR